MVIAEMLGVPPEDREPLQALVGRHLRRPQRRRGRACRRRALRRAKAARSELVDYFRGVVAAQRRRPPGDDLLTALVQAEEGGGRLTEDELYSTAVLLLIAGNETTTNLIGNGLLALLRHPDQLRRVWGDEALVAAGGRGDAALRQPGAADDAAWRKTTWSCTGTTIAPGQWVFLVLAAANRDPAQFPDPDRFDVGRADNKHVAFGAGAALLPRGAAGPAGGAGRLRARCAAASPALRLGARYAEYRNNFNLRGPEGAAGLF